MTPHDQGEIGGGSKQEPEDKPPFLREEEKKNTEMKCADEGNKAAVEQERSSSLPSLYSERREGTQPSTSSNCGAINSKDNEEEEEEEEEPGRQLKCLEIPDFLMCDVPEGSSGKKMVLMVYVLVS